MVGELEAMINDLPDGGQHGRVTLGFAPEGALHVNIGSSCNFCYESTEEQAANLRVIWASVTATTRLPG